MAQEAFNEANGRPSRARIGRRGARGLCNTNVNISILAIGPTFGLHGNLASADGILAAV